VSPTALDGMIASLYSALLAAILGGVPPASQMPAVAPPAPSPMPVVTPPPVFTVADRPSDRPASTFEIEVGAGTTHLWSATVRAGYVRPASFRQSLDQAVPDGCNVGIGERQVSQRVEVSIAPTGFHPDGDRSERPDGFMIVAIWTRPASPGSCPDLGTRTVQVQRIFALRAGEAIEIEGDAGFRIRLRRIG
jgi:hypothetical protein